MQSWLPTIAAIFLAIKTILPRKNCLTDVNIGPQFSTTYELQVLMQYKDDYLCKKHAIFFLRCPSSRTRHILVHMFVTSELELILKKSK